MGSFERRDQSAKRFDEAIETAKIGERGRLQSTGFADEATGQCATFLGDGNDALSTIGRTGGSGDEAPRFKAPDGVGHGRLGAEGGLGQVENRQRAEFFTRFDGGSTSSDP